MDPWFDPWFGKPFEASQEPPVDTQGKLKSFMQSLDESFASSASKKLFDLSQFRSTASSQQWKFQPAMEFTRRLRRLFVTQLDEHAKTTCWRMVSSSCFRSLDELGASPPTELRTSKFYCNPLAYGHLSPVKLVEMAVQHTLVGDFLEALDAFRNTQHLVYFVEPEVHFTPLDENRQATVRATALIRTIDITAMLSSQAWDLAKQHAREPARPVSCPLDRPKVRRKLGTIRQRKTGTAQ